MSKLSAIAAVVFSLLIMCNPTGEPVYYHIELTKYISENYNTRIEFINNDLALLFEEDTLTCSLSISSLSFLPTCYTNFGPSRKYEYKIFDVESLSVCTRIIRHPAALYYRYEDTGYIEEGIILGDKYSIENNQEYNGIKFLKM